MGLRELVIFTLLSRSGHLPRGPAIHQSEFDRQYRRLLKEVQSLFTLFSIAS